MDELYKCPQSGTKFVDFLNGVNFIHFLDKLDSKTTYYLIDKSIFTWECLKISIEKKRLSNIFVINKDIMDIETGDIGDDISVIRANNPYLWLDGYFGPNWEKECVIQKTENIRAFDSFIYRRII